MDELELMPVDLVMRFHFKVNQEDGKIETRAEAIQQIIRCNECGLNAKCPILKNHAFMDEDSFWCAYAEPAETEQEEDDGEIH